MVYIARRVEPERSTPNDPAFGPLARRQLQFADWTPRTTERREEQVEAYSNCDDVELFLNGKSLGSKPRPGDASARVWRVAFEPGTLKAVARNHGKIAATHELRTAGKSSKIVLLADRAKLSPNWEDVCQIQVSIADAAGILVPDAADLVTFNVSGPGRILAVDNADNSSHEPFQAESRHAYQGHCLVLLKATAESGKIKLTASAAGLSPACVEIRATRAESIDR